MLEIDYPTIDKITLTASSTLPQFAIYLFKAGIFLGFFSAFVSLIMAGVMYLFSAVYPMADLLGRAKDRVTGAISGVLILATVYLIATTINPALAFFTLTPLPPAPPPPETKKAPGIYFNITSDCNDAPKIYVQSVQDLGDLRNRINSVGVVKDSSNGAAYIAVLYDNVNFRGACQYINPNKECSNINPFASSASIYQYNSNPNGDGVYFYRKSFFNEKGGSYKVSNSQINGIYYEKLDNLKFQNVPEEEQDCVKYDKNGECMKGARVAPTLGGQNISSIQIKGNYFVLLVYASPKEESGNGNGKWTYTSCQGFPTSDDINKNGPQQIKWEDIINNNQGVVPNYVIIIPVTQK